MEPIAVEIRAEILAACDAGEGTRIVAVRYGVSESWVRRVKQQRRESEGMGRLVGGESHCTARHLFARAAGRTQSRAR